jgi:thioesterase domain-containing protein
MPGYYGDTELNKSAFMDGWFRTGDIGSLDEDGFLTLHGRISEMINRGGEKISPQEIDCALLRHPEVVEAAAFAVTHARLGQDVAAAVVLCRGSAVDAADLRQFLTHQLVPSKIPRLILVLDELPKGLTGKIQRQRLSDRVKEPAAQGLGSTLNTKDDLLSLETELLCIWRRLLKSDAVTINDSFFGLGGDSLLATEMLIEIEKLIGQIIPESILATGDTIRELLPKLLDVTARASPVVDFHADDASRRLFWFHGDFTGGGYYVRRFAAVLGSRHPVTAIAPHGLNDGPIPASIEQMASDRLPLVLERQCDGPYRLGGYCNGAFVALETARLLVRAGHQVEMVAMVDPPATNAHLWSRGLLFVARYVFSQDRLVRTYRSLSWRAVRPHNSRSRFGVSAARRIAKLAWKLVRKLPRRIWSRGGRSRFPLPNGTRQWRYDLVMAHYIPNRLAVRIIFFSAANDARGWHWFSDNLEDIQVPGDHEGCVKEHAAAIAGHLQVRLEDASSVHTH